MRPGGADGLVLGEAEIRAHVARLGAEIAHDHPDGVVLVGVLTGALVFLADLARAIPRVPVAVDFIALSRFAPDSGRVRITHDLEVDVAGRDVVLVEAMVDTGLTLGYLLGQLRDRGPRRVEVCTLLDRTTQRLLPLPVRYRGIEVGDELVVGYGLRHGRQGRNLPFVERRGGSRRAGPGP